MKHNGDIDENSPIKKRYRLYGTQDSDELNSYFKKLKQRRNSIEDEKTVKRYRLEGKRYRIQGKRYRIQG